MYVLIIIAAYLSRTLSYKQILRIYDFCSKRCVIHRKQGHITQNSGRSFFVTVWHVSKEGEIFD